MEILRFQCKYFQLKKLCPRFFEKCVRFSENLSQNWSLEKAQNFQWLSHKNMLISQTESYAENPCHRFLKKWVILFLLGSNTERFTLFKTKPNSNFGVKVAEKCNLSFSVYLMNHFIRTTVFFNIWQCNICIMNMYVLTYNEIYIVVYILRNISRTYLIE